MTSHSGRDDEPREGVILPSGDGGVEESGPVLGAPAPGQPWGQPWGPGAAGAPAPPQGGPGAVPSASRGRHALPQPGGDEDATAYIPPVETTTQIRPVTPRVTPPRPAAPPVDSEGATQFIPPVPPVDSEGATQFIPPVPADDAAA
ncbi:hypothetical protein ACSNOC_23655, partial [Streptomyces sp. URMC 129]